MGIRSGSMTGKFRQAGGFMADDWYYAQNSERKGPVHFAKLEAMAKRGWRTPDDLVWRSGVADWTPAWEADGGEAIAAI